MVSRRRVAESRRRRRRCLSRQDLPVIRLWKRAVAQLEQGRNRQNRQAGDDSIASS